MQILQKKKNSRSYKLSKENADLRVEVKKLNAKLESIEESHEKECKQIRVNFEVEIDDLEQELTSLKEKLDGVSNAEAVSQKLSYWKEKAKNEAKKKQKKLEREIIQYGDKNIMAKLFGGK